MSAFLIIDITILNTEAMEEYEQNVLPLLAQFGGKPIAYDNDGLVLEGAWNNRVIIVEFPDKDAAKTFFNSVEYAPWKIARRRNSDGRAVVIQGISEAG